ncbi:MAG: hypothetical protein KGL52_02395 [Rhodospirillales bacterium]|nr:hypothetical protein [Rhodospirillales bacterium]
MADPGAGDDRPPVQEGPRGRVIAALFAPRPLPLLLLVAFAIGAVHAATMFAPRFVAGLPGFWTFPRGIVAGAAVDTAQLLVGYLYLLQSPWTLPLLHVGNILPPHGINALWLDPVPWLALVGRGIYDVTGRIPNLLGAYVFLAFSLPGVAMTWLLSRAGQRNLLAAVGASLLADAAPFLLQEWGHVALCGQVLTIFALALYLASLQRPDSGRIAAAWFVLLAVAFLTHLYLFVMVGGIWVAGVMQRGLNRGGAGRRLMQEAVAAVGLILAIGLLTGILSWQDRVGGTSEFGQFSLNLGSPFVPQLSGVIPPLRHYWIGMHSQVLGYLGLGALLVLACAAPGMFAWLRERGRHHAALLVVLAGFYLFALSNKVTLGSHVLLHVALPSALAYMLGAFRASGRFFWPVGYAALVFGVLIVLRRYRPGVAVVILGVAGLLQIVDVAPLRQEVAASARAAVPPVVDRAAVDRLLARAHGVMIFPSFACIGAGLDPQRTDHLQHVDMEIQLLAAWRDLPTNSAKTSRDISTDCRQEAQPARLRPGVAYFFTAGGLVPPSSAPAGACRRIGMLEACLVQDHP